MKNILKEWQDIWNVDSKGRHYNKIKNNIYNKQNNYGRNRKKYVTLTRMRLGHTGLNAVTKHECPVLVCFQNCFQIS